MNRRQFLTAATIAGASSATALKGAHHESPKQGYLELIRFEVINNARRGKFEKFLGDTVIPALNKQGCNPIGVFRPKYGAHGSEVYVLVPHPDINSFLNAWDNVIATSDFKAAADTEMAEPLYDRMESSLLKIFSNMPKIEIPKAVKGEKGRIFELRTYESHNRLKGALKIEMINDAGEIAIFRNVGLDPVFFGQTLAGPLMPNLVYMLGFKDMEARDKSWAKFSSDPDWDVLKKNTRYANTVSAITDVILSPSPVSQI
jgi:hypothetical protein